MATTKVTFTLDPDTLALLRTTAERLALPKSAVVREAIRDFSDRARRLGEGERRRLLATFDRLVPAIPKRPLRDVERELAELRRGASCRRPALPEIGRGRRALDRGRLARHVALGWRSSAIAAVRWRGRRSSTCCARAESR